MRLVSFISVMLWIWYVNWDQFEVIDWHCHGYSYYNRWNYNSRKWSMRLQEVMIDEIALSLL